MAWTETHLSQPCENCGYRKKNVIDMIMCKECRWCCPYDHCSFDESDICFCCREKEK